MTRILPSHLDELECQAEEEALRAATLRDRAKLDEFAGRAEKALRGLKAIEKAAEEAIYEMDRERKQREMSARAQTWCKAHELVVSGCLPLVLAGRSVVRGVVQLADNGRIGRLAWR